MNQHNKSSLPQPEKPETRYTVDDMRKAFESGLYCDSSVSESELEFRNLMANLPSVKPIAAEKPEQTAEGMLKSRGLQNYAIDGVKGTHSNNRVYVSDAMQEYASQYLSQSTKKFTEENIEKSIRHHLIITNELGVKYAVKAILDLLK